MFLSLHAIFDAKINMSPYEQKAHCIPLIVKKENLHVFEFVNVQIVQFVNSVGILSLGLHLRNL